MDSDTLNVSIVLPAKNEGAAIGPVLEKLTSLYPNYEIIVVNDGSTDNTLDICEQYSVKTVSHPHSIGNGAAVKSGARAAKGDILVFMDADGQHSPEDVQMLIDKYLEGYSMVVGARSINNHASFGRKIANSLYNKVASSVTSHEILDLTSGFRVVDRHTFERFLYLLPNGFSYPTTSTMAFFRSGLPVAYQSIEVKNRIGKSHIKPLKDGLRFLVIIVKIASLYSPLKVFTPVSIVFTLLGFSNYAYTFFTEGRFTNMSALLIITAIFMFMMGLLAEQITVLTYAASERRKSD